MNENNNSIARCSLERWLAPQLPNFSECNSKAQSLTELYALRYAPVLKMFTTHSSRPYRSTSCLAAA